MSLPPVHATAPLRVFTLHYHTIRCSDSPSMYFVIADVTEGIFKLNRCFKDVHRVLVENTTSMWQQGMGQFRGELRVSHYNQRGHSFVVVREWCTLPKLFLGGTSSMASTVARKMCILSSRLSCGTFQILLSLLIAVQAWALRILMSLLDMATHEPK